VDLPPFDANALFAAPDGGVLVARVQVANDTSTLYDHFDRRGRRVSVLRLRSNERVVGSGVGYLYAVALNDDGFEALQRYRR